MNSKGLTMIELLVVIVVVGIIAGFTAVALGNVVGDSKISVDSFNIQTLNTVTEKYSSSHPSGAADIFNGINDDYDRMIALVEAGYLQAVVRPQQDEAVFEWDINNQTWNLIGGTIIPIYSGTSLVYDFGSSGDTIDSVQDDGVVSINMGKWDTDEGYLENTTGETRLFIPINQSTYTINVNAALNAGNNGGYGIFFHTTLRDGNVNKDDGYIFQFDRGYGDGAMIVRPRVNGRERGSVWTLRAQDSDVFPRESENPSWWTDTHTIKIVVTNIDSDTCNAEFFIDGQSIGNFEFDNETNGQQIYTGFRGWGGSPTKFYEINIG